VKTENGRVLTDTHDANGTFSSVTTTRQYGFIPDVAGDFQVGEIRGNIIMGKYVRLKIYRIMEEASCALPHLHCCWN